MENVNTTKDLFLKARSFLREGSNVTKACKRAGIPRSTYYAVLARKRRARMMKLGLLG
jgi:hypothetical protein